MNFKRGYPREKKMVEWSTPLYVQLENEEMPHTSKWYSKRKYPCKKLKGEHNMIVFETKEYRWFPYWQKKKTVVTEYRCSACGKKKLQYEEMPV